jgi:hypothetical protein
MLGFSFQIQNLHFPLTRHLRASEGYQPRGFSFRPANQAMASKENNAVKRERQTGENSCFHASRRP